MHLLIGLRARPSHSVWRCMTYGRRQDLLGEWTMDRTNTPGPRPVLHMSADALLSPSRSLKSRYPVFGGGRPLGFGLDLRPTAERRGRRGRPLLAGWEALTQPQRHPAASLASAATHVAILLLALFFPRSEHKDTAGRVESQSRSVRMVYLLPKEVKPKPRPQHQVMPAFAAPVSRPGQESPSPTTTEAAPEHDAPAATSPQPRPRTGEAGRSSTVEREDAMVSEARRLFGPKAHTGATLAGPVAAGLGGAERRWHSMRLEWRRSTPYRGPEHRRDRGYRAHRIERPSHCRSISPAPRQRLGHLRRCVGAIPSDLPSCAGGCLPQPTGPGHRSRVPGPDHDTRNGISVG
jgi:hypothetical protein